MDFERPTQPTEDYRPAPPVHHDPPPRKKSGGLKVLLWFLVFLLVVGAGAAGYFYRDMTAKDQLKKSNAEIASLKVENNKLKEQLAAATVANTAARSPSDQDLANIKAAVESGNYAAIQQLLSDPVTVILAASEGLGERTPAQAVGDLAYLDDGEDPWNFSLTTAILDGYKDGDYAKYFPQSAMVGKSKNGYVVSFSFDETSGKISTIFMTNSEEVL